MKVAVFITTFITLPFIRYTSFYYRKRKDSLANLGVAISSPRRCLCLFVCLFRDQESVGKGRPRVRRHTSDIRRG